MSHRNSRDDCKLHGSSGLGSRMLNRAVDYIGKKAGSKLDENGLILENDGLHSVRGSERPVRSHPLGHLGRKAGSELRKNGLTLDADGFHPVREEDRPKRRHRHDHSRHDYGDRGGYFSDGTDSDLYPDSDNEGGPSRGGPPGQNPPFRRPSGRGPPGRGPPGRGPSPGPQFGVPRTPGSDWGPRHSPSESSNEGPSRTPTSRPNHNGNLNPFAERLEQLASNATNGVHDDNSSNSDSSEWQMSPEDAAQWSLRDSSSTPATSAVPSEPSSPSSRSSGGYNRSGRATRPPPPGSSRARTRDHTPTPGPSNPRRTATNPVLEQFPGHPIEWLASDGRKGAIARASNAKWSPANPPEPSGSENQSGDAPFPGEVSFGNHTGVRLESIRSSSASRIIRPVPLRPPRDSSSSNGGFSTPVCSSSGQLFPSPFAPDVNSASFVSSSSSPMMSVRLTTSGEWIFLPVLRLRPAPARTRSPSEATTVQRFSTPVSHFCESHEASRAPSVSTTNETFVTAASRLKSRSEALSAPPSEVWSFFTAAPRLNAQSEVPTAPPSEVETFFTAASRLNSQPEAAAPPSANERFSTPVSRLGPGDNEATILNSQSVWEVDSLHDLVPQRNLTSVQKRDGAETLISQSACGANSIHPPPPLPQPNLAPVQRRNPQRPQPQQTQRSLPQRPVPPRGPREEHLQEEQPRQTNVPTLLRELPQAGIVPMSRANSSATVQWTSSEVPWLNRSQPESPGSSVVGYAPTIDATRYAAGNRHQNLWLGVPDAGSRLTRERMGGDGFRDGRMPGQGYIPNVAEGVPMRMVWEEERDGRTRLKRRNGRREL